MLNAQNLQKKILSKIFPDENVKFEDNIKVFALKVEHANIIILYFC